MHGMRNRKSLKGDPFDSLRLVEFEHVAKFFLNRKVLHHFPGLRGSVHRAGRAGFQAKGMVGMGMCDRDRMGPEIRNPANPTLTAIDHDFAASMGNHR